MTTSHAAVRTSTSSPATSSNDSSSSREPAPRKQRPHYTELSKEKKRVLASLDPQGEMLHEMIEGVVNFMEDKLA